MAVDRGRVRRKMQVTSIEKALISAFAGSLWLIGAASAATFETNKISFQDITGTVDIKTTNDDEIDVSDQRIRGSPVRKSAPCGHFGASRRIG